MTARTWFRHAGKGRSASVRGPASRKGEQRFVGPDEAPEAPPVREEYPGPQSSSSGERIEPGQTRPSRRRGGDRTN
jgi:hypothetical protein